MNTVKQKKIKTAVLIPSLSALIAGIVIMVVIVGVVTSKSTKNLTTELIEATVSEYINRFEAICNDGYAIVRTLAPIIDNISLTSENPREEIFNLMKSVLNADNGNTFGIWTCWEPNAFDGKDNEYADKNEYHDSTGRFIPYIYKYEGGIISEALVDYDEPGSYYQGARTSGKPDITDPYSYAIGNEIIDFYSIAIPIWRNGAVAGVIGMDITLDEVKKVMNGVSILEDGYMCVLSPDGVFAAHSNETLVFKHYSTVWMKDYADKIESIFANGGDFQVKAYSDVIKSDIEFFASGIMIGDTGKYWAVCGMVPEKTVNASSNFLLFLIIAVGVVLIAVVSIIIYIIVNKVSASLKVSVKRMEEISERVASVSNLFNKSSAQIADGASNQSASIEETSATMNETSSMISQNAENTRQAAQFAKIAKETADSGKNKMREMLVAMDELKTSSNTISKIIKTIDDIAFQTNLLAINATVEAARAGGDAGRSFSVVAEEVRNLAQKSKTAAANTAEIIEQNIALTNSGREISGEVADSLDKITHEFENLNKIIGEVNAASEEQANGVKQINQAISQMEKATRENAAIAEKSSVSADDLLESSNTLASVTAELSAMI